MGRTRRPPKKWSKEKGLAASSCAVMCQYATYSKPVLLKGLSVQCAYCVLGISKSISTLCQDLYRKCAHRVPGVLYKVHLLCARSSPQSVPTVCQVLYINPVYCRPDIVHKVCLLCAGCSLKFMPTKCQEHSIKHNYCVEGTLCKACLLCAKYAT